MEPWTCMLAEAAAAVDILIPGAWVVGGRAVAAADVRLRSA